MKKDLVLVVDMDPQSQRLLRAQLLALGYQVQVSGRGEDGIVATAEFEPEVILLATALPGIDGPETCRRIREWSRTPIIALSAGADEQTTVTALDAGADDCVTKPFRMIELLARIRAVRRRAQEWATPTAPEVPLTFRNLNIDPVRRRVVLEGRPLHLTPTEYELLRVLTSYAGRVVTHRELLTHVWGPASAADTQYLHVFVSQLRRKLESGAHPLRHILTEPGVGYQFIANA